MTGSVDLGRLLGWHLLLPARTGRRVHLEGFPEGAAEHWTRVRGENVCARPSDADFRLYWEPEAYRAQPGPEGIAVLGGHGVIRGSGSGGRLYALLSPKDPRLVLPLQNKQQTVRGLALHRPGRWVSRAAVAGLSLAARLKVTAPLRRRILWISGAEAPTFGADAVLYLGSTSADRKTTILPAEGNTLLKHGDNHHARAALRNEALSLRIMSSTSLSVYVPQLVDMVEGETTTILEQEYRPRLGRFGSSAPLTEIRRFLERLAAIDRQERSLASFAEVELGLSVDSTATMEPTVIGHRCHGDFAPWNVSWTSQGLFVFDWEESTAWAPAFSDAFYFIVAQALHVQRALRPQAVARDAQAFASQIAQKIDINPKEIPLYWKLWLSTQQKRRPAPFLAQMLSLTGRVS